jgi:glycosyltransferase involved in cell wall biosynthesis
LGGEEGEPDSLEFLGQVDDPARLVEIYRSAFCLVYPSFYESSGLPPVEAMACRCPVIASDIPVLVERCGEAALYCDPKEPADIARKIEALLDDPTLRASLIEKGVARAGEFTWRNCALQTLAVMKNALQQS